MAELERGLVAAGFRVVSWNAIRHMVVHEEHVTPLEAAQELDASILFQVNSLERTTVRPGKDIQWNRTFYHWDLNFFQWFFGVGRNGSKGAVAVVPEERATALERGMQPLEAATPPPEQVSVTVNATAIKVDTGEAIWFYFWTHNDELKREFRASQLFECNPRALHYCIPQGQSGNPNVAAAPPRSGSRGSAKTPPTSANPVGAAYYKLVREVVRDMVGRFERP